MEKVKRFVTLDEMGEIRSEIFSRNSSRENKVKDILDSKYWAEMRFNYSYFNRGRCGLWSGVALKILREEGLGDLFELHKCENFFTSDYSVLNFHYWLETHATGKRFIADGTAAQIDSFYEEGFYGFFEDASEKLKILYNF